MTPPLWLGQTWLAQKYLVALCQGLWLTATLAFVVCIAATAFGIVLAAAIEYGGPAFRYSARVFIQIHRNTPLMVQIFLWYFGVPNLFPEDLRIWLNTPHVLEMAPNVSLAWPSYEFLSAFLSLSLYSAAFIAGEIASGIRAIADGQREASRALGLSAWMDLRWIILPQVVAHVRQPMISQYTGVIKNTSLTMAIGVAELSYRSRQVESETLLTFQAFAVATALYLTLILVSQWLSSARAPAWKAEK